jgi:Tfp pilus assembly protein PilN
VTAQKKNQLEINLLPQEDANLTTGGKVLRWLLSTFRYLVITTEVIVILAFLSRFYFDSRAADLNDEIAQKQEFIEAYSSFESDFRLIQKRLAILTQMTADSNLASPIVQKIVASLPENVSLQTIRSKQTITVDIDGSAVSERDISQFVSNLGTHGEFEAINLTKVESEAQSPQILFSIQIVLTTPAT